MAPGFANGWHRKATALLVATQLGGCVQTGIIVTSDVLAGLADTAVVTPELRSGAPFIPAYTISDSNVSVLRTARRSVELGEVSRVRTSGDCSPSNLQGNSPPVDCAPEDKVVYCGTGIHSGADETFTQYFQSAFNQELAASEQPASPDRTKVSIALKKIDVYCFIGSHSWELEVIVTIGDRAPYTVKTAYSFEGAFSGALRYQRARHGFVPAVQKTISEIINHPTFRAEYGIEM